MPRPAAQSCHSFGGHASENGEHQRVLSLPRSGTGSVVGRRRSCLPQWEERVTQSRGSCCPGVVRTRTLPRLPEPLTGAECAEAASSKDVPDRASLEQWLRARGVSTDSWGQGQTKDAGHLWKELHSDECGLELWRKPDGALQPVRVVHVLRAKVCTQQSFHRGIFLFNTWQQYGDGRRRTRNGLLSEKLGISEMPIEENLHSICCRAVAEELQQLTAADFRVAPESPLPDYDRSDACPVKVLDEHFVDHTIEVEVSKSYEGLLTVYHLYTVEIVCEGLPSVDFNSLEFKPPDEQGNRALKYLHAWTWLQWSDIQRYLLEGSTLKERKCKGSFDDASALASWLGQFDVDMSTWGEESGNTAEELFQELEHGVAQLELWGRHDGVPLLMRVVHKLQLEVTSRSPWLAGKLLVQTWRHREGSEATALNDFPSRSLSLSGASLPFDEASFNAAALELVKEKLSRLVDPHFRWQNGLELEVVDSGVKVLRSSLGETRYQVDESQSFTGLCTLYHRYEVHVECEGLPASDFASIDREPDGARAFLSTDAARHAQGFRWVTWQEYAHLLRSRVSDTQLRQVRIQKICEEQEEAVDGGSHALADLEEVLQRLASKTPVEEQDPDLAEAQKLLCDLQESMKQVSDLKEGVFQEAEKIQDIPPSMLSQMTENIIATPECLSRAASARREQACHVDRIRRLVEDGKLGLPPDENHQYRHGLPPSPIVVRKTATEPTKIRRTGSSECHAWGGHGPASGWSSEGRRQEEGARLLEAFARAAAGGKGKVPAAVAAEGGRIPVDALARLLENLNPDLARMDVRAAIREMADGRADVGYQEFVDWLYR